MSISRHNTTIKSEGEYSAPTPFQVDQSRLDQGVIEAYAAIFGPGLKAGAFKTSLEFHRACGTAPLLTWNCCPEDTVGRITSISEDSTGLKVTCQLALNTERGSMARQEILAGIDGLSCSFDARAEDAGAVTEAHVWEVSFMRQAGIPATETAAPEFENAISFEKWLRENGVAKNAAKRLAAGGWNRLRTDNTNTEDATEALARVLSQANNELFMRR